MNTFYPYPRVSSAAVLHCPPSCRGAVGHRKASGSWPGWSLLAGSPIQRLGKTLIKLGIAILSFQLVCLSAFSQTVDRSLFLDAIAHVETGNNPRAIGRAGETTAYQLTPVALREVGRHGTPKQRAERFLILCEKRLTRANVPLTPDRLGLVWNVGYAGAKKRKWKPNDYARRVDNLYKSK